MPRNPRTRTRGRRQTQEQCHRVRSLQTPYNEITGVPPMVGILFTITPTSDISVLSLEIGVIPNGTAGDSDHFVEVFTMKGEFFHLGDYLSYQSDPSEWSSLFQGQATLSPTSASLILPTANFTPLAIRSRETYSLYVTMRGSYLNCVAQALQKTGEVQLEGDDIAVTVGAGLAEYKFPENVDPIIDPQFSGAIYYKRSFDCVMTTTVTYPYIFNKEVQSDDQISSVVDEAMSSFLSASTVLRELTVSKALQKSGPPDTVRELYTGQCPSDWSNCPRVLFRTTVSFQHDETLDSSRLTFELYLAESLVTSALKQNLRSSSGIPDMELIYLGYNSIASKFSMSLTGVPFGIVMDSDQSEYFQGVTALFLSEAVDSSLASNFNVEVANEDLINRDRNLTRPIGSLGLSGQIRGTRFGYLGFEEFSQTLQEAFQSREHTFLAMTKTEEVLLESTNHPGTSYFEGLQSMSVSIDPADGFAQPVLIDAANPHKTAIIIGSTLGAVVILSIIVVVAWKRCKPSCLKKGHEDVGSDVTMGNSSGSTPRAQTGKADVSKSSLPGPQAEMLPSVSVDKKCRVKNVQKESTPTSLERVSPRPRRQQVNPPVSPTRQLPGSSPKLRTPTEVVESPITKPKLKAGSSLKSPQKEIGHRRNVKSHDSIDSGRSKAKMSTVLGGTKNSCIRTVPA